MWYCLRACEPDKTIHGELKEEVLDAISKSKDTRTTFLHAERIDQAAGSAYMDASDVSVLAIDQRTGQTSASTSLSLSVLSDDTDGEGKGSSDDYNSAKTHS